MVAGLAMAMHYTQTLMRKLLPPDSSSRVLVDEELARLGLERRVVLRAPLLATVGILTQSDMVAALFRAGRDRLPA